MPFKPSKSLPKNILTVKTAVVANMTMKMSKKLILKKNQLPSKIKKNLITLDLILNTEEEH